MTVHRGGPAALPILALVLSLAACAGAADSPVPSASPSDQPSSSALTFCDPQSFPTLVAPDGTPVVVDGSWSLADNPFPTDILHIVARQAGECFWLVFTGTTGDAPAEIGWAFEFHGRIGTDFRIVGEFSEVYGSYPGDPWTYGPMTFQIEFPESGIELVEERAPGELPPGCGTGPGTCPAPIRFVRPAD